MINILKFSHGGNLILVCQSKTLKKYVLFVNEQGKTSEEYFNTEYQAVSQATTLIQHMLHQMLHQTYQKDIERGIPNG